MSIRQPARTTDRPNGKVFPGLGVIPTFLSLWLLLVGTALAQDAVFSMDAATADSTSQSAANGQPIQTTK